MPRLLKITKRRDFLAANSYRWVSQTIIIQARCPDHDVVRVGYTVTKKVGNAVSRNKVKRRLRVVASQILTQCGVVGVDYVIIARKQIVTASFSKIINDFKFAVRHINRLINECD